MAGSPDTLFQSFTQLARTQQPVKLINVFKGVPLVFDANVIGVTGETVQIKTDPQQIVGLSQEKQTYVQSDRLPGIVRARVVLVDLVNDHATLADFELAAPGVGERQGIRVVPAQPVDILVEENGREVALKSELLDISQGGLSFVLASEPADSHLFNEGSGLILHLELPAVGDGEPHQLRLEGSVIYVRNTGEDAIRRIGVKIFPDEQAKAILADFVSHRQTEIMGELNTLLEMLYDSSSQ